MTPDDTTFPNRNPNLTHINDREPTKLLHKGQGRPSRLTSEQKQELEIDLKQNPRELGYDSAYWTAKVVLQHVRQKFGVSYEEGGALRLLQELGTTVERQEKAKFDRLDNLMKLSNRLDGIESGSVPLEEVGTLDQESALLGLGNHVNFLELGEEWVALRHPEVPVSDRRTKLKEFYGQGVRKTAVFRRLDSIDAGKIPITAIGTLKEESAKLNVNPLTYKKCGEEWVASRHPEVDASEHSEMLAEYYGLGARKMVLFRRLDMIDAGTIPLDEIGTRSDESSKLGINVHTYSGFCREWVESRYPNMTEIECQKKMASCFGTGARMSALFRRLGAIDAGNIPLSEIGSRREESAKLRINPTEYAIWGVEWVSLNHPEVPLRDRRKELAKCFGQKSREVALNKRLDAIDAGVIPISEIGSLGEEAAKLDINAGTYTKQGTIWVGLRHSEIPIEERRKLLAQFFGQGAKKKYLRKIALTQLNRFRNSKEIPSLGEIAQENHVSKVFCMRIFRRELEDYYQNRGMDLSEARKTAEITFRKMFPKDNRSLAGQFNHPILEYGANDVFTANLKTPQYPEFLIEYGEESVKYDILIDNVHEGNWLSSQLGAHFNRQTTFSEKFLLDSSQVSCLDRLAIDFTTWDEITRLHEKAEKYARPDTLLFIALTADAPCHRERVQFLHDYPNVRIISTEMLFRFLGANTPALEKVKHCCTLTRKGDFTTLEAWKTKAMEGNSPRFTEGQQDLELWLKNTRDLDLLKRATELIKRIRSFNVPSNAETLIRDLNNSGQKREANQLDAIIAITRVCNAIKNTRRELPPELPPNMPRSLIPALQDSHPNNAPSEIDQSDFKSAQKNQETSLGDLFSCHMKEITSAHNPPTLQEKRRQGIGVLPPNWLDGGVVNSVKQYCGFPNEIKRSPDIQRKTETNFQARTENHHRDPDSITEIQTKKEVADKQKTQEKANEVQKHVDYPGEGARRHTRY